MNDTAIYDKIISTLFTVILPHTHIAQLQFLSFCQKTPEPINEFLLAKTLSKSKRICKITKRVLIA